MDGFETSSVLAAFWSSAAGWIGGTLALSLAQALLGPSGANAFPYVIASVLSFAVLAGFLYFLGLWLAALMAHGLLRLLNQQAAAAYAGMGAVLGMLAGPLVIGFLNHEPVRAALCGIPVGAACGLLFRHVAGVRRPPARVAAGSACADSA
jgi:hypothetical protein